MQAVSMWGLRVVVLSSPCVRARCGLYPCGDCLFSCETSMKVCSHIYDNICLLLFTLALYICLHTGRETAVKFVK